MCSLAMGSLAERFLPSCMFVVERGARYGSGGVLGTDRAGMLAYKVVRPRMTEDSFPVSLATGRDTLIQVCTWTKKTKLLRRRPSME